MICSYSPERDPLCVETPLSHAPVHNAVNTKILTNLFPYLHTDLNHAFKTEFPSFFHAEQNCCQTGKKKLRTLRHLAVLNLLSAA